MRAGGCDNVAGTSSHSPTSALSIPLTTNRASHTDITAYDIIAKQKAPPHTPGHVADNIHTHQYRLSTHYPIPNIWPSHLAIEVFEQAHYTNHTETPEHPFLMPPLCHHNPNTNIKAYTQPQTYPTQPYKQNTQIPPTQASIFRYTVTKNFVTKHKSMKIRYHRPDVAASGVAHIPQRTPTVNPT